MLQIIGGLYISGWVLSLVALITVFIKYKKKMKRIKNLYNYGRHCDTMIKCITFRASEIDKRMLIDNKEERRIELWEESSNGEKIRLSSVYYVDDPKDISDQDFPYIADLGGNGGNGCIRGIYNGGSGGSGGYNPLANAIDPFNIVINTYYRNMNTSKEDKEPEKEYKNYAYEIPIEAIFISEEAYYEFERQQHKSLANSYVYVVNPYTELYDRVYRVGSDGYLTMGCSNSYFKNEILCSMSSTEFYNLVESKRKANYKLFRHFNFYLRNEG